VAFSCLHPVAAFLILPASAPKGPPEVLGSDAMLLDREDAISIFRFPGPVDSIRPPQLHEYITRLFLKCQTLFLILFHRGLWKKWDNLWVKTNRCRHAEMN